MKRIELIERQDAIKRRMSAICADCEKENRQRNEAEDKEWKALVNERNLNQMKLETFDTAAKNRGSEVSLANADSYLRSQASQHKDISFVLKRDTAYVTTEDVAGTGIIPVAQQQLMGPLRENLIWDKVGLPLATGLKGQLRWPFHSATTCTWEGETTRVGDSAITFSKLTMEGKRLACAIPVSNTSINDSSNVIEQIVTQEMPIAISYKINESMFTLYGEEKVGATIVDKPVVGPFAQFANDATKGCEIYEIGSEITRATLLKMKAKVVAKGIELKAPVWVMNENTKADLEDTKVDAGSGRFVLEDGKIFGIPVFTTSVPDGFVGFGDFSYQPAGFFGETSMVIDPYTLARNFSTDFVLNMRFGTVTLRKEAFILGRTAALKTAMTTALTALKRE